MTGLRRDKSLLLIIGTFAVIGSFALVNPPDSALFDGVAWISFCALLMVFIIAAAFVIRPELSNLTSFWTFMILLQFGLAPLVCGLLGIVEIGMQSVKALAYVFLGTVGFWIGSRFFDTLQPSRNFVPGAADSRFRPVRVALALFLVGGYCRFYMITHGLYSYVSDIESVEASSSYLQWLGVIAGLTIYSQIIVTIEYFQSKDASWAKLSFYLISALNVVFGLISGMKNEVLIVPLSVLLIGRFVTGKTQWRVAGYGVAAFLVLVPVNTFYRDQVRSAGSITSLQSGNTAYGRAISSANENTHSEYLSTAVEGAAYRLNLLESIVFIDQDQGHTSLEGDEKLWMLPYYTFIPRFLWKGKPVLDKGRRLSVAMGVGDMTSTAVTPFGDLLDIGGIPALFLGMILVGAAIQIVTNFMSLDYEPKIIFVYMVLFTRMYSPEPDVFGLISTEIQTFCVAIFAAYLVYGSFSFKSLRFYPPSLRPGGHSMSPRPQVLTGAPRGHRV